MRILPLTTISRSREVYENARANGDSLIAVAQTDVPEGIFDLESLWYVAGDAFEQKPGKDLYDYIDHDNFTFRDGNCPQFDFNWTEEDPESRKRRCPWLFDRFDA